MPHSLTRRRLVRLVAAPLAAGAGVAPALTKPEDDPRRPVHRLVLDGAPYGEHPGAVTQLRAAAGGCAVATFAVHFRLSGRLGGGVAGGGVTRWFQADEVAGDVQLGDRCVGVVEPGVYRPMQGRTYTTVERKP